LVCHDIKMLTKTIRKCLCKKSSGRYMSDGLYVENTGPCRVIGMINHEYISSLSVNIIPFKTKYTWFPIISDKENHVYKLFESLAIDEEKDLTKDLTKDKE
jgi:hypothetical protein